MSTEDGTVVEAMLAGDQAAFGELVERYRRQLQVHCHRMVGSFDDAEDLVQETLLRAWHKRSSFERRASFRSWLFRIATNACLDFLASRPVQPVPDLLLDASAGAEAEPHTAAINRETIELAFLAAIQHLPPRQRVVLILRDVLGWSARETAALLETSVAAVNSALQRARPTLKAHLSERRLEWAPDGDPSEAELALLQRYMDAHERSDVDTLAEVLREDARPAVSPDPAVLSDDPEPIPAQPSRPPVPYLPPDEPEDRAPRPWQGQLVAIMTFLPELLEPFRLSAVL